ncbi:MAG: plastocyanin/azurin family copper-binding protein [Gemmatimonadaceae bacterium]
MKFFWVLMVVAAGLPRLPQSHTVRLDRNRFMPAQLPVHPGDTVRFVNGEGGPHNVEFDKDSIAPAERKIIEGAMGPDKILPLSGPIMMLNGQVYTFVVPDLPAGRYAYLCSPHWANMKGAVIVER